MGSSFGDTDSLFVAHGLSCSSACGILLPQPGIEPVSPALQGRFLTTGPPGKSPDPHTSPLQAPSWLWFKYSRASVAHIVSPCCPNAFHVFSASLHGQSGPCSPLVSLSLQTSSWLMLTHSMTYAYVHRQMGVSGKGIRNPL